MSMSDDIGPRSTCAIATWTDYIRVVLDDDASNPDVAHESATMVAAMALEIMADLMTDAEWGYLHERIDTLGAGIVDAIRALG